MEDLDIGPWKERPCILASGIGIGNADRMCISLLTKVVIYVIKDPEFRIDYHC